MLERDYVSPNGRPFLLLNGGDGGWHQPQQLILFLLYADAVHAVVTLDGFNERYFVGIERAVRIPAEQLQRTSTRCCGARIPTSSGDGSPASCTGEREQPCPVAVAGRHTSCWRGSTPTSRSQQRLVHRARADEHQHHVRAAEGAGTRSTGWSGPIGQYRKYIRAMDAVAAQNGVLFAHFIQPVPAIRKTLTADEKAVVGDLGYRGLYERITGDVLSLAKGGTPIFSLLDVFEHNTRQLMPTSFICARRRTAPARGTR